MYIICFFEHTLYAGRLSFYNLDWECWICFSPQTTNVSTNAYSLLLTHPMYIVYCVYKFIYVFIYHGKKAEKKKKKEQHKEIMSVMKRTKENIKKCTRVSIEFFSRSNDGNPLIFDCKSQTIKNGLWSGVLNVEHGHCGCRCCCRCLFDFSKRAPK